MAEWRVGRGWSHAELDRRLAAATGRERNFEPTPEMTPAHGWNRHASRAVIARESPGPPEPGGPLEQAWRLVKDYAFSDPRIVKTHFDPAAPLLGRHMLLELQVMGLHYLGAAVVASVRDESDGAKTVRGFRYDTLVGHLERGAEWFLLEKDHASGDVTFQIRAAWRPGDFPNAWSRLGFWFLGRRYQRAWHRLAHLRLRTLLGSRGLAPLPSGRRLLEDEGPARPIGMPLVQQLAGGPPRPEILTEHERDAEPDGDRQFKRTSATDKGRHDMADMADVIEKADRAERAGRENLTELIAAWGMGLVSGSRSMLAPALVSRSFAGESPTDASTPPATRIMAAPATALLLSVAALAELVGDKTPWVPARTSAAPVMGRLASGALVGASMSSPDRQAAGAVAGAAGALAGTYAFYDVRRLLSDGLGMPNAVAGLCEDAIALGLGYWILRSRRS